MDEGFVLVVALLALAILGAIVAIFGTSLRSHLRDVGATVARAEAESLADAGINLALLDLLATREQRARQRRFAIDGTATACQVGEAAIEISIADEAGRVDLNTASEPLLEALLTGAGAGATAARAMTQAILDFRDPDSSTRPNGAEAAEYRAAGLTHGPKNAPFDAIEEISLVLGLDANLIARLQPFLTVHSGVAGLDPDAASPALLSALLVGTGQDGVTDPDTGSLRARFRRMQPRFVSISGRLRFTIRATARLAGAVFVREAVIEIASSRSRAYTTRVWRQGVAAEGDVPTPLPLPAC